MRKFIVYLLIAALLLCSLPALAQETVAAEPTPATDTPSEAMPVGSWISSEGQMFFQLAVEYTLTDQQRALMAEGGFDTDVPDPIPAGTLLSMELATALWPSIAFFSTAAETPDAPDASGEVSPKPQLPMFELTGEWFYDESGTLCYRHTEDALPMTIDEVYDALTGGQGDAAKGKTIYLTIDDAPSAYTIELLAVLRSLDVKATFFVVGAYVKNRPEFTRAIYDEGHLLANHSYSHNKEVLSASFSSCLKDFQRTERIVSETLGFELPMPILRVPYGASTIPVGFRTQLQELGYLWIDWNALNGDTESGVKSDKDALERAFTTGDRQEGGDIVMLVHDGKKRTIRTLPEMVAYFRDKGYTFDVLHTDMEKIPGVRMGLPLTQEQE